MLNDTKLKNLKRAAKAYKVPDRDGMYATVLPSALQEFLQGRESRQTGQTRSRRWIRQLLDRTPAPWQDTEPPTRSIGFSSFKNHGSGASKLLVAIQCTFYVGINVPIRI